jgi:N-acetylated-alpha-linked acidic dipeptidase
MCPFRLVAFTLAAVAALGSGPLAQSPSSPPLRGFSPARAIEHRALEARFDATLKAANLREWMQRLSAHPHHVGSRWGKENAEFMAGLLRSWGFEARIEQFDVLFPTPVQRRVELVAPTPFVASLVEPSLKEDATSGQTAEQLPVYNAYSIDGDVTGELVYVNYGVPADYEELARRGIDVKGKIVIARYGGSWRGIKPKVAAERGAIGCLIYSDPRDDGYFAGEPYPAGGFRPEAGAQRGSVADMPLYPGDPLTPFVGATKDATRVPREQAQTLTKIPVLPIAYADALPLLKAVGGPVAPSAWRGALPITYRLGPGPAKVRLQLEFEWSLKPAYDVIGVMAGAEFPDQWIVRGNHHDAWVNGAADPVSGMVAVLEEARAVGELARNGWRPRRTLVYAGWDAEEPGLLGSVEWVEAHARDLDAKAIAYINSDSNSRGFLDAGGSHTLEALVNEVAQDVKDPRKGIRVGERLRARAVLRGRPDERTDARAGRFRIDPLGSGSDYTPFLQHLGIASLSVGFGGEGDYGQYHSIYDSFDHYTRFMDPSFEYGIALAQIGGRLTLRLAQADVLPFEMSRFAASLGRYVDEIVKLTDDMRTDTEEHNRRVDEGAFAAVDSPYEPGLVPSKRDPVPAFDFAPLKDAHAEVERSAGAYERALASRDGAVPTAVAAQVNAVLLRAERALTRREGLPRRPWFRHQVYAPGFYTGYGVKTLPAVREALEEREWPAAKAQIAVVAGTLRGFAAEVEKAARLLQGS